MRKSERIYIARQAEGVVQKGGCIGRQAEGVARKIGCTARTAKGVARKAAPALLGTASLVMVLFAFAPAHELKDVSLFSAGGQVHLKLGFSPNGSEGDYPLYFQKTDLTKGTITLSFLETESAYPLGRHPLEAKAPALAEITLKKITSPSGKNFLGVELKLKQAPIGDAPVQAMPKGVLSVDLGKGKGKFAWSLAKSIKEEDSYLSAKAEAPPKLDGKSAGKGPKGAPAATETMGKDEAARAEPVTPAEPSEPGVPKSEPSASSASPSAAGSASKAGSPSAAVSDAPVAASESQASQLTEMKLLVTAAQENLILVFNPPASPNYTPKKNAKDSSWLELTLDNVTSGLAKREYTLPKSAIFKRVKVNKLGARLQLRIQLALNEAVNILPQEGGLALSGLGKGDASPAFQWTTAKPEGLASESAVESGEPVKSAHEDGEALEAGHGGGAGKGLSSSKIFSVGPGTKTMILLKDSAVLKDAPGAKGKLIRKIAVGEKVEKIENLGANLRVVAGADTGFIKAGEAVYEDEVTPAQEKGIQSRIDAKAAKAAKEEAKVAAAAAREEARHAASVAKEAEKQRKADELAKKKADAAALAQAKSQEKAQAKAAAQAQAAAQEPPQGIQEAQAQSMSASDKPSGKNPGKAQPGMATAGQTSAGGPKLAIADNPELADKLAQEKLAAEDEKKRIEPEENRVSYNSYGRRDPFIPVEQGASDNGIDIDQMKVVGIIWQAQQPMAVLEHNREAGVSFTVKEGDPVHNGRVARISRDAVTFDISEYGISRSYSLKLVSSKEGAKK